MGQTLTNGIYLPNEGERNCYSGLAANWNAVDTLKGNYSLHAINVDIHVTAAEKETWNGKADASALTAHTGDTTIHVTSADKQAWNGKADASALTAHTGDTTIHVTSADKQAWDGHVADSVKHVTAEDKNKWDAVTSKADDSDVVHKSGDETVAGVKTFSDDITLQGTTTPVIKTISNIVQDSTGYNGSVSWVIRDKDNLNNILESVLYKYSAKSIDWQLKLTGIDNGVSNSKGIRFTLDPVNNVANFIPIGNNSTSLGNSSTKWKGVYATNYYYGSNNVEFSTKFVTTDTNQTISGNKTFSNNVNIYNSDTSASTPNFTLRSSKSAIGTSDTDVQAIFFSDKNGISLASVKARNFTSNGATYLLNSVNTKDTNDQIIEASTSLYILNNGRKVFRANADNDIFLGYSLQKWKDFYTYLINGLEPSSLSLPSDINSRIDISSYFTNTGTGQSNSYTVPANGYIYLTLSELTNIHCFSRTSGNVINYAQTFTKPNNSTGALYVLFPVRKNDVFVATWYTTTTVSVDGAFFIPCKGNI